MKAIATLLLVCAAFLAGACPGGEADEPPMLTIDESVVDANVISEVIQSGEARVFVALTELDVPFEDRTTDAMETHTATVQASILSVLTPDDFTLAQQFPISAAISGTVTESGLEKLSKHPNVIHVGLIGGGELH